MPLDVIRVVIIDDQPVVRAGLRAILSRAPDILVVGEASAEDDAKMTIERTHPHVAIVNAALENASATLQRITAHSPAVKALVLASSEACGATLASAVNGAANVLLTSASEQEYVQGVRIAAGHERVAPSAHRAVTSRPNEAERFGTLSERENIVFRLVARGYSGPEIGQQLQISAKTVETYKQRIQEKLGVGHRTDYIRLAMQLKLFDENPASESV